MASTETFFPLQLIALLLEEESGRRILQVQLKRLTLRLSFTSFNECWAWEWKKIWEKTLPCCGGAESFFFLFSILGFLHQKKSKSSSVLKSSQNLVCLCCSFNYEFLSRTTPTKLKLRWILKYSSNHFISLNSDALKKLLTTHKNENSAYVRTHHSIQYLQTH